MWGRLYNTTERGSRAVHSQQACTPQWVKNEGEEWALLSYVSSRQVRLMLPGQQQQKQVVFEPGQVVAVSPSPGIPSGSSKM